MKPHTILALAALSALALLTPLAATAQTSAAPGAHAPADLIALPRCVWSKLKPDGRAALLAATQNGDAAATAKALTDLKANTLDLGQVCSKSINHDASTGDEVLVVGLKQEAAADLLARDVHETRKQLDAAIAAAPPALTAALRKVAGQIEDQARAIDPMPALDAIVTALHRPAKAAPLTAAQNRWLAAYVLGHFQVLAAADTFDPSPKE